MTMKRTLLSISLLSLFAALAFGQAQTLNLTSGSVLATVNYDQNTSPRVTGSIGYLTPFNATSGTESYSLLNVVPVPVYAKGLLTGFTFQTSVQTGVFQRVHDFG